MDGIKVDDDVLRLYGPSLVGLEGFLIGVSALPYAAEEFDLAGGLKTLEQRVTLFLKANSVTVLSSEEYAAAESPGKLDVCIEFSKSENGTIKYAIRVYVVQLAVLERDLSQPKLLPVISWLSPRLLTGEVSESIAYQAIEKQVMAGLDQFIDHYRRAR